MMPAAAGQAKHLTQDQYAMNHPAGRIGKRLILRVADVMLSSDAIPTVDPTALITHVLGELSAKGCGCVLVVGPDMRLLGTFTDGDLRRSLQSLGAQVLFPVTAPSSSNPCGLQISERGRQHEHGASNLLSTMRMAVTSRGPQRLT